MVPPSTGAIDQVKEPPGGLVGANTPINVVVDPASTVIEAGFTESLVTGEGSLDAEKPPPQPVRPRTISGTARITRRYLIIMLWWTLPGCLPIRHNVRAFLEMPLAF